MAPALQRIGIDIKQTIRFGIGSNQALDNMYIYGPGAAIPSITKAIGEHLELHMHLAPGADTYEPQKVGGVGSVESNLVNATTTFDGLLPGIAKDEVVRKKLGRAVLAGCAVAALAMGAEFTYSSLQQQQWHQGMQQIGQRLQAVNEFEQDCQAANQIASMIGDLSALVEEQAGSTSNWVEPLAGLSEAVSEGVRLLEMRGENVDSKPCMIINGLAVHESSRGPGSVLENFVEKVGRVEQVSSVQLGATTRVDLPTSINGEPKPDEWGVSFTLRVFVQDMESPYAAYATVDQAVQDWSTP